MDVSVIIVNYNTLALTQQCVDSIFEKTSGLDFEVIIVDNGSTDGSKEAFSHDSRIQYIYSEENLGFGRANNLGAAHAKGDYLFFLNSDTYLVNHAISLLWEEMKHLNQENAKVACAGCMLTDEQGEYVHSYARFPSKLQSLMGATIYPMLWKLHVISHMPTTSNDEEPLHPESCFEVDYVTGADLMVRKAVADQLGLFDPDFFMYFEETEMQHRYGKAGYVSVICRKPKIVHLEGKSNRKTSPGRLTQAMRSEMLYFKKTSKAVFYSLYAIIYKILHVISYTLSFPFIHGTTREKRCHLWDTIKM